MAKSPKRSTQKTSPTKADAPEPDRAAADQPDKQPETPEQDDSCLDAAAEAVERARAELHRAQQLYERLREEAAERLEQVRETTVGDLFEGVRAVVRKFPGPSVVIALVVGFLLGRKSRW